MLNNRSILLTGGARGLGAEIAKCLSEHGAKIIIADIDAEEGRRTANKLGVHFFHVDLEDPNSIEALLKDVAKTFDGKLDGLVNNAAIATGIGGVSFEEIDLNTWDKVMRVNVRGTWLMTRAAAPLLRASGSGRVVNIASDTAIWGAPLLLSYVASKGAIISTAVAPGILTTDSTNDVSATRHSFYNENRAVPGPQAPEDITETISFLLTKGALTLTGQLLTVNNGFVFS